jgi:cathepsin A (carboxypeptidase C)
MIKVLLICLALLCIVSCDYHGLRINDLLRLRDTNPIFLNESYYAGFEPIDNRGDLFYWLFESRADKAKDPLVVWLTGGPGCASEIATFIENGPFKINPKDLSLKSHPYSWNNNANLLFLDQPLGTGFSRGKKLVRTEEEIAADFYTFMTEFLKTFPQFEGRDLFITGESYAGHYIPAISTHIVKQGGLNLKFKGVAIGNGLMSVYWQYPGFADFAYENKLVDQAEYKSLQKGFKLCQNLVKQGLKKVALAQCQSQMLRIVGNPPRFNLYDIRLPCEGPLCYDFSFVDNFLDQPKVKKALGVTGRSWEECNNDVHRALSDDWMTDLTADVSFLIQKGLQVLIYHGDQDFICNWKGGETVSNNFDWSGKEKFANMGYSKWEDWGEVKHLDNLTFLRIFKAGHMVPMDQPEAALVMLDRFMKGW